jgi:DNA-binding CsgD family transcriptional regulator
MAKSNMIATGHSRNSKRVRGNRGREDDRSFSSMQSELMSKTLELIQLKDAIGNAHRVLLALKKEIDRADHKVMLREALRSLQVDGLKKRDWELFHMQLRMYNEPFMEALCKKFPNLSHQEIRIASLLKSGMTTKEIAELFSIQVRTVENHRFSIRKKMNLATDKDLVSVLQNLV